MSFPRLLSSCIIADNSTPIRNIKEAWLPEEERPLFRFVRNHLNRHGRLPTQEALQAARLEMPAARRITEPPSYYAERIRTRYSFEQVNSRNEAYVEAMGLRNMVEVSRILREMLSQIGSVATEEAYVSLSTVVQEVQEDFLAAQLSPGLRGFTMGWPTLDALTLGLQPGDIFFFSGRPGLGKSWCMIEVAYNLWLAGVPVLLVTMEMGRVQLVRRFVGRHSRINPNLIRAGELSTMSEAHLNRCCEELRDGGGNFWIMQGDFSKEIEGVERLVEELDPAVILIDAYYLMSSEGQSTGRYITQWESLRKITSVFKKMLIRMNKAGVASVQLNRNVDSDSSKANPGTEDIAGGDAIPQDASGLAALIKGKAPHEDNQRQIILFKNREGDLGRFDIHYQFSPVNLSEVENDDPAFDVNWMVA